MEVVLVLILKSASMGEDCGSECESDRGSETEETNWIWNQIWFDW